MKPEIDGQAVLLFFVDVRKAVGEIESTLESKLCNETQGLVPSPHVELIEAEAVVNAPEVVIVILPPLVEVSVGELEDGGWKCIPPFVQVDDQVAFEDQLPLNMGQILSIPLVIAGFFVLAYSYRRTAVQPREKVK